MKREFPNFNQIMLLGRQWDLQSEPQQERNGFCFAEQGGRKLLRIVPLPEAAFCFCLQKYLYQRGFYRGLRFIPNKYGDAYAVWGEQAAFLTDDYAEYPFAIQNEYDIHRMAGLLAEFHLAAEGLEIPAAPLEEVTSPLEYAFWLTEQLPPPMTAHMLPIYERLCSKSQRILEKCSGRTMNELCEEALHKKQVVHGRFRAAALCEYFGELLITDYSCASFGLPVWDLAYLLDHAMLQQNRERCSIRSIIAEYEKLRRLSGEEKSMLRHLLQLPMEFIYALSDWQEQRITGEQFAELLLREEKVMQQKDEGISI